MKKLSSAKYRYNGRRLFNGQFYHSFVPIKNDDEIILVVSAELIDPDGSSKMYLAPDLPGRKVQDTQMSASVRRLLAYNSALAVKESNSASHRRASNSNR